MTPVRRYERQLSEALARLREAQTLLRQIAPQIVHSKGSTTCAKCRAELWLARMKDLDPES